jgi:hypothetical protein
MYIIVGLRISSWNIYIYIYADDLPSHKRKVHMIHNQLAGLVRVLIKLSLVIHKHLYAFIHARL